jgi:hypothetical protein
MCAWLLTQYLPVTENAMGIDPASRFAPYLETDRLSPSEMQPAT